MCPMYLIPYGNTGTCWNRNAKYSVGLSKDIIRFRPRLCFSGLCCDGNVEAFCSCCFLIFVLFFFFCFLILTVRSKSFFRALSGIDATLLKLTSQKECTFLLSVCINFPQIRVQLVGRSQTGNWKSGPSGLLPKSQLTLGRLLPTSSLQHHL